MTQPSPIPAAPSAGLKPGYRTTEFWVSVLTVIGLVVAAATTALPDRYAAIGSAISAGAYAIARGLAKLNPPKNGS